MKPNKQTSPEWNICVISRNFDVSGLKNALIYGDHVTWVDIDLLLEALVGSMLRQIGAAPKIAPVSYKNTRMEFFELLSSENVGDRVSLGRIATRVEPIVREAAQRTRELAETKWRKLYVNVAQVFGFAGASFFDPKLVAKAVQKTLETGALAFSDVEDKTPGPKNTAQFVLRAHHFMMDRTR